LIGLKRLYLSYNNLIELPKEIGNLRGLQEYDLSGNKVTNKQLTELLEKIRRDKIK
jgi:Leucine-rich repeat (LRR) protein